VRTQQRGGTEVVDPALGADRIRSGLIWSLASNLLLRLGGLAVGIALARMLTPAEFGAYAVALTVQTVLMTVSDLGLSVDLIRTREPSRRAPTVSTLGVVISGALAVTCAFSSGAVASALGSPDAATAIAVLSTTLVLSGLGIAPYAHLQRVLAQRTLFGISFCDLAVSTTITLLLVADGHGIVSLAIGRVAGATLTLVLQYTLTGMRPRFGWSSEVATSVLRFGSPVAGANLLSWVLISIDYVIVARIAGPALLGFYVLAFQISNWPMTAVGQVVRSVALPAFSRLEGKERGDKMIHALALTGGLAALAGVGLGVLALPLIEVVYGTRWAPAASILTVLAVFGAIRVVFDLVASYLLAVGHSRSVLLVQLLWVMALIPALVVGVRQWGGVGAATAHLVVAVCVVLPAYLWALEVAGHLRVRRVLGSMLPPILAAAPVAVLGVVTAGLAVSDWASIVIGSATIVATFAAVLGRWMRHHLAELRAPSSTDIHHVVVTAVPGGRP
jgi:lipopolysaccharide exporter